MTASDGGWISTAGEAPAVDLGTALLAGLAPDGGLYLPATIPRLTPARVAALTDASLTEIGAAVLAPFVGTTLSRHDLRELVEAALDFPIPLVALDERIHILELFHGPTLAFKDVAARIMARLLPRLDDGRRAAAGPDAATGPLTVLTATSGDTGGAVAQAFVGVDGTRVAVLYPRGRVTAVQERQIATLGRNVRAFVVDGSFDDCQRLVKAAFADPVLGDMRLTSANSINIGRLLPQTIYYFHAVAQLRRAGIDRAPLIATPSGNFGNLTAGLIARRMGLPVAGFVAATNLNDVVPAYLEAGVYRPRPSRATMSSAMDVGDPSNLTRIRHLYGDDVDALRADVRGFRVDEDATARTIRHVARQHGRVIDPHTAVGLAALRRALDEHGGPTPGVVLATAHPAKFPDIIAPLIADIPGCALETPERIRVLSSKAIRSEPLAPRAAALRQALLAWDD